MTIEELKNSTKEILTPTDIAPLLGCDANTIRHQAKENIQALGFPAAKLGSRIKIPRKAFIAWFVGQVDDELV